MFDICITWINAYNFFFFSIDLFHSLTGDRDVFGKLPHRPVGPNQ